MDATLINYLITILFTAYSLYYVFLFVASLRRKKFHIADKHHEHNNGKKHLVLVPAHNEENVISEICQDLLAQDYPPNDFRVIIVADNCDDGTVDIVHGFQNQTLLLMERKSDVRGKGAALDYALTNFEQLAGNFNPDYVIVLDADNRVSNDFLSALDSHACIGYPAIQCNVKTKNPDSSLLAKSSYYEGLTLQRLWQEGKDKLGLCNALAGTGEAIRYDLISTMKFGNSLTDDLDLTIRLALKGMKVKYAHYPETYDEKPNKLSVEMRRRVRWATGHFQTYFKYSWQLVKRPSKVGFDAFFYLSNIMSPIIIWLSSIISALYVANLVTFVPVPIWYSATISFVFIPLFMGTAWLEGDSGFLKNIVPFYILMALWLIVAPIGLAKALKGNAVWERTPHGEKLKPDSPAFNAICATTASSLTLNPMPRRAQA